MIKGVGPQRAELLAQRGIYHAQDLRVPSPFAMKRPAIHFSKVKDIRRTARIPFARRVMSGQAVRSMARPRRHLSPAGAGRRPAFAPCKVFHGGNL